jgi:glycine cleavage system H protein
VRAFSTKYAKTHEWVRVDGDVATCGISDHAAKELGDVVFVEMPSVGTAVESGEEVATVESVKASGSVYAPLTGEVCEVNDVVRRSLARSLV